jgi:hypothetical protein
MEPPRDPLTINDKFPMEAWPLIQKAISKNPDDRFSSAREMLVAVRELCSAKERQAALVTLERNLNRIIGVQDLEDKNTIQDKPINKTNIDKPPGQEIKNLSADRERSLKGIWTFLIYKFTKSPGRLYFKTALIIISALFFIWLFKEPASSGKKQVKIKILNLPSEAQVYWNDKPVDKNPFFVTQNSKQTRLKIEINGKKKMSLLLKPTKNRIIRYKYAAKSKPHLKPSKPVAKAEKEHRKTLSSSTEQKKQQNDLDSGNDLTANDKRELKPAKNNTIPDDTGNQSGGSSKKRTKNPFKRLGQRIRNAFRN